MAITVMLLIVVGVGIGVGLVLRVLLSTWHRHRKPPELRGNWWPEFEREFRSYAKRAA